MEHSVYQLINIYKSRQVQIDDDIKKYKEERESLDREIIRLNQRGEIYLEFIKRLEDVQKTIDKK